MIANINWWSHVVSFPNDCYLNSGLDSTLNSFLNGTCNVPNMWTSQIRHQWKRRNSSFVAKTQLLVWCVRGVGEPIIPLFVHSVLFSGNQHVYFLAFTFSLRLSTPPPPPLPLNRTLFSRALAITAKKTGLHNGSLSAERKRVEKPLSGYFSLWATDKPPLFRSMLFYRFFLLWLFSCLSLHICI